jgi:hypothetical protein
LLYFIAILAIGVILAVLYFQLLVPFMELKKNEIPFPPKVGDVFTYVVNESERSPTFTIGKSRGNIVTKCAPISEGHLTFLFKKNPFAEEYDIIIKKGGPTLFKPPRVATYSLMDPTERLESHEIIGKSAEFRISGQVIKERMINYIEISLTSKFFFTKMGKERLQFLFKIEKIHPNLNLNHKDDDGNFYFGKEEHRESVTDPQMNSF